MGIKGKTGKYKRTEETKKCGFNMIRLTEEEINSGEFKERLVL